jgi:AcrR family transcriptional regulator
VTEPVDRRADATRRQIVRAAAHQFAHRPYSLVNLDDILSDAKVTKGALYFHFRSKYALASTIVETWAERGRTAVAGVLARRLSGVESLIDVTFLVAVDDIGSELARASLNLLESVGRTDSLQARVLGSWIAELAVIARAAIDDGDVVDGIDAAELAKLLVSMYLGIRQTSTLDDHDHYLADLERAWKLVLPGFAKPDRIGYLTQFIRRRTALAVRNATPVPARPEGPRP